jgi:hypothetical protein
MAEHATRPTIFDGDVLSLDVARLLQTSAHCIDNAVKWRTLSLKLPPSRLGPHFVKAVVRVHEYPDGTIAVFLGPDRLADHQPDGTIVKTKRQERSGSITSYRIQTT